jgi:hypothetical protein
MTCSSPFIESLLMQAASIARGEAEITEKMAENRGKLAASAKQSQGTSSAIAKHWRQVPKRGFAFFAIFAPSRETSFLFITRRREGREGEKGYPLSRSGAARSGRGEFGGDDLAGEGETLAAAGLGALGAIGGGRAGGAVAGGLADLAFANRITDANDHGEESSDNARRSQ